MIAKLEGPIFGPYRCSNCKMPQSNQELHSNCIFCGDWFSNYEDILIALKNGNVPANGARSVCMGREKEVEEFERVLDKVDEDEKAIVKFVNGEFGAGKSFF